MRKLLGAVLVLILGQGLARAADPPYEIVVSSGTLLKVDMGKKVTFVPDEKGKPGKQVTLDVVPESAFLETSASTVGGKTSAAVKAIKQTDLLPAQKQPVSVIYAKVGDANHLLVLAAGDPKLPKGFVVGSVRGVLNKIDGGKTVTMQPFVDNKFGKQEDLAVLPGSKFFEMAPKTDSKHPYTITAAKLADLSAKRQAIAVLFARMNDDLTALAVVTQPAKEK